jgi:hypothetical protein
MCAPGIIPRVGEGLQQLQSFLGLGRKDALWDAVLVSFDLKRKKDGSASGGSSGIHEIGISMLDTRSISSITPAGSLINGHFAIGRHKKLSRRARKFHFRTSEHVDRSNITEANLSFDTYQMRSRIFRRQDTATPFSWATAFVLISSSCGNHVRRNQHHSRQVRHDIYGHRGRWA